MLEINLLDVGVVIILLVFLVRGLMRGLTREVGGLLSVIGGFALARHFQGALEPTMQTLFSDRNVAGLMSFLLIFLVTVIAVTLLVIALRKFMSVTLTIWIDYLLGGIAGFAKALLVLTVLFYLARGFFPHLALIENAQATPVFNSLADYLRAFIPDVFTYRLPVKL